MRLVATIHVLVLVVLFARPVQAEDRAAAERSFRTAERAYKAQNFEAAAHHYEEAYKQLPLPEIAFSAAQAYRKQYRIERKLSHLQRAIALYESYLDKVKTGGRVSDAADNLGEMKTELLRLQPTGSPIAPRPVAPAALRTQIAVSPQLATERRGQAMREVSELEEDSAAEFVVTIDGKPVKPFVPVDVTPGLHKIRVEAAGFVPAETEERAIEGVSRPAEIVLSPIPGQVTIATERGARISVDNRRVGVAPLAAFELPAGRHVVTIARSGRRPVARELTVTRGGTHSIREPLSPTVQRRAVRYVALAAGGLAVLTVGTGIYAAVADNRAQELNATILEGSASRAVLASYNDAIDRRDQLTTSTWFTAGAAVAVGLAAVGLYLFDSPGSAELRLAPTAGSTGGGLSLGGRF